MFTLNLLPYMDPLYYSIMQQKTNKELVRLVYFERNNFHHEGVSVAEEEISRRKIKDEEINTLKVEINGDILSEKGLADEPLELSTKIATLFLPGALPFIMAKKFEDSGHIRKARELRKWSGYGFVMYGVLVISLLFLIKKK